MLISDRIFAFLEQKNMTQREFAAKTGIPASTISDWKHKRVNPSADKILIICKVLEVTPQELLSGAENPEYEQLDYVVVNKESAEYTLLEQYRHLDGKTRERLLGYLEALSQRK